MTLIEKTSFCFNEVNFISYNENIVDVLVCHNFSHLTYLVWFECGVKKNPQTIKPGPVNLKRKSSVLVMLLIVLL